MEQLKKFLKRMKQGQVRSWKDDAAACQEEAAEYGGLITSREEPAEYGGLVTSREEPAEYEGFIICHEQVAGQGEDFFAYERNEKMVLMGVFDGCGGSGAKVYPEFGNHTGAYVASRALAGAVKGWFRGEISVAHAQKKAVDDGLTEIIDAGLKKAMDAALRKCRESSGAGSMLLGSLKKEFPSTIAVFAAEKTGQKCVFYWCGDSRGYVLDSGGLHQVTVDNTSVTDAMANLREDAPMTNVASASHPYIVHRRQVLLAQPSILLTATDGCFGYLPTPMEFEKLLLETLMQSSGPEEWRDTLIRRIVQAAGDDFTMAVWLQGFTDFEEARQSLKQRFDYMRKKFPLNEKTEEKEMFRQWETYRGTYEKLMERKQNGD